MARDWGLKPPGTFVYADKFVPSEGAVMNYVDNDGSPDSAGLHGAVGGVSWALVDLGQSAIPSRTGSHEGIEITLNQWLDQWVLGPDGWHYAREGSDAVQRHHYTMGVALFGEFRDVLVSNYLLPSYFDANGKWPYDHMGVLTAPFSIADGGYAIVQKNGVVDYLATSKEARMEAVRKARYMGEWSRTARIAAMARIRGSK